MRKVLTLLFSAALIVGTVGAGTALANDSDGPHDGRDGCPPPFFPINTILGSPGRDVINGTRCDDRILGFQGNDTLRGKRGEDRLRGGRDNDRLVGVETFGFPEFDVLNGGGGFDRCIGDFLDVYLNCEDVIEVEFF